MYQDYETCRKIKLKLASPVVPEFAYCLSLKDDKISYIN